MKRAFTLIELLIVIAIIAILALIAVPNFLEAQVRAKVSRVYSDQRTIGVAIEAYAVDWGRPIIGEAEASADYSSFGLNSRNKREKIYSFLTTPTAFLTSVPFDPFTEKGQINRNGVVEHYKGRYYYQSGGFVTSNLTHTWNKVAAETGVIWTLHSFGPSRQVGNPTISVTYRDNDPNSTYDATNGTLSYGYIYRNNKGSSGE